MRLTPCECPVAGWCERHQCLKSEPMFQLCRRNRDVFRAWEDGNGKCIPISPTEDNTDQSSPSDIPSASRRVMNLASAAVRHAMSGFERANQDLIEARLEICRQCASCEITNMICREKSCGCYVQIKAGWASESCPLLKWPSPVHETTHAEPLP